MDEFDILQLRRNPDWRTTLEVYHELHQRLSGEAADFDGWMARLIDVSGIEPAQLSAIHGKLIAHGMLKFDVGGRDVGVRYQLTHQGRRALLGETANAGDAGDWADSA
jgi:acyl dehydratase